MKRWIILITTTIATLLLVALLDPIPQDLNYHRFADTRELAFIPNFLNVFSNLPFLLVGSIGLTLITKLEAVRFAWAIFFVGVLLVGFGSSYYHLGPNNPTLVWDRLPMTIGFMALFVALLSEWFSHKLELLLIPMCLLGIASVYYWSVKDDLRFYAWIQFFPLLYIALAGFLFKPNIPHIKFLYIGLAFYIFSKIFEFFDNSIYILSNQIISGHTIKHLSAAFGTYCIYLMLKHRNKSSVESYG